MGTEGLSRRPLPALIGGVLAVSSAAVLARLAEAPPVVVAFYRLFFSVVLLSPGLLWRPNRAALAALRRRDLALAAVAGVALAAHWSVWFASLEHTSVLSSTVLVTTQPFFVMLLGWWLWRERVPRWALGAVLVAFAGAVLIGAHGRSLSGRTLYGDLLALLAAILVSVYLMVGQRLRSRVPLFPYVMTVYAAGSATLALVLLATGTAAVGYPPSAVAAGLGLAAVPTVIGHTLFNWVISEVGAAAVAVSVLAEPIGATALAALLFGERPSLAQWAGAALILMGVGWYLLGRLRREQEEGIKRWKPPSVRDRGSPSPAGPER